MLRISFDPDALETIKYERLHHPHPRVQQKMWVLWLKACEVPHYEICRFTCISENTLRSYLGEFVDGGGSAKLKFPTAIDVTQCNHAQGWTLCDLVLPTQ